jgi:hypothetical protein
MALRARLKGWRYARHPLSLHIGLAWRHVGRRWHHVGAHFPRLKSWAEESVASGPRRSFRGAVRSASRTIAHAAPGPFSGLEMDSAAASYGPVLRLGSGSPRLLPGLARARAIVRRYSAAHLAPRKPGNAPAAAWRREAMLLGIR